MSVIPNGTAGFLGAMVWLLPHVSAGFGGIGG